MILHIKCYSVISYALPSSLFELSSTIRIIRRSTLQHCNSRRRYSIIPIEWAIAYDPFYFRTNIFILFFHLLKYL